MTSPQPLELLDLRHFTGRQLRPLLEQEAEGWNRRLRWDYRPSTELLLQYLDSRVLPGFVALARGRVCGFCFCVYEGQKAVIGDVYASLHEADPIGVVRSLTRHLLETLEASPDVRRTEAQLLLFDEGTLAPLFRESLSVGSRLEVFPRLFLELDLMQAPQWMGTAALESAATEVELCPWSPGLYQNTAELIQQAYQGHLDSEINDQYRTVSGSQRFLHNIIRFPGCGVFDAKSSFALRERSSNRVIAVILCSRVAPDTAHVTQLCVAEEYRGRGFGKALLDLAMRTLPGHRYRFLTLTVSVGNVEAVKLYKMAGFTVRQRFDALVIDRMAGGLRPVATWRS